MGGAYRYYTETARHDKFVLTDIVELSKPYKMVLNQELYHLLCECIYSARAVAKRRPRCSWTSPD